MFKVLKVFGIIFVGIFFLAVLASLGSDDEASVLPRYTIISESTMSPWKRSMDVRIERRATEEELRAIAAKLKARDRRSYNRTFISYYLPGMKPGSGHWASTHYEGDKVQVDIVPNEIMKFIMADQ